MCIVNGSQGTALIIQRGDINGTSGDNFGVIFAPKSGAFLPARRILVPLTTIQTVLIRSNSRRMLC